jgi:hypothetical protein
MERSKLPKRRTDDEGDRATTTIADKLADKIHRMDRTSNRLNTYRPRRRAFSPPL